MKIVFQHPSVLPVKGYGGTERILFWHMKELVRQGHKVVFIGPEKSTVSDHGIEHIAHPVGDDTGWIPRIPADADILHLQYAYRRDFPLPVIFTIHGNGQIGEEFPLNSVFVGKKHAANHGSESWVHNALDFSEYPLPVKSSGRFDRFCFLAKASWKVKNVKSCIRVCKALGKKLDIMGGNYWLPSRYIKGHGMCDGETKIRLLSQSDGLLFPVRWQEPFGIAIVEAMALGKPVFGSKHGSLPEIINQDCGRTFSNEVEMTEDLRDLSNDFSPQTIGDYVRSTFPISSYSEKYLKLYDKVIKGENLNIKAPCWTLDHGASTLEDF